VECDAYWFAGGVHAVVDILHGAVTRGQLNITNCTFNEGILAQHYNKNLHYNKN